jgi:hypothetical protein
MCAPIMRQTILHIEFFRTSVWGRDDTVTYTMSKYTPFGHLTTSAVAHTRDYFGKTQAHMDGDMYTRLSEQLNREEHARVLEGAANSAFSVKAPRIA